eukprot:scaffold6178_cov143-Skeletonema_menzelii.AAC.3
MTVARLFIPLLSTALISTASAQRCEAPSNGCTYGMFNYDKCICECIKPFCPDANGDCVVPLDNCGGNPWEGCTRGVDCPWWGSLSNGDTCNTGSAIPAGVWSIYNTREICCGVHAPFSSVCNQKGPNGPVYDPNKSNNNPDNSLINEPSFETGSGGSNANVGSNPPLISNTNGNPADGESGLPGWAIALIVIPLLILICCIGYCIFVRNDDKEEKGVVNILFNNPVHPTDNKRRKVNPSQSQNGSSPPPRRRRSFAQRGGQALRQSFARRTNRSSNVRDRPRRRDDGRSRRSSFSRYDSLRSSFTGMTSRVHRPRRSRGDRSRRHGDDPSINLSNPQDPRSSTDEFTVNTYTTNKKSPQEPPMNAMVLYEPNYAKPDPEGSTAGAVVLALTNGENNTRSEEPNTKPKLEPEETFAEPQQVLCGRSGDDSNDEDEYDSFEFRHSQPQFYAPKRANKTSEEVEESLSFATEDPEEEERRRAKKSRKKKKKAKREGDRSNSRKRYEESDFTLEIERSERDNYIYMKKDSGVKSIDSDVGSIELESQASA